MCDKRHFEDLEEVVEDHGKRIGALERTDAVHDSKLESLTKQIQFQMITMWAAFFLVLLALIWGACGPQGFNAVTTEARQFTNK